MSKDRRVSDLIATATNRLKSAEITTARLDVLVLMEDATGKDRAWLLAHPEFEPGTEIVDSLDTKLDQRARHIPLAYIRGKAEFYGREFIVNAHTLVPRPETETMIDLLKHISRLESDIMNWEDGARRRGSKTRQRQDKTTQASSLVHTSEGYKVVWGKTAKRRVKPGAPQSTSERRSPNDRNLHLIDVGTGSGAIAVTAKLELPEATVSAIDIDENCLEIARRNAEALGADVAFLHGNLLEPLAPNPTPQISILLCNLPYVPDNFQINTAATHEPRHALFGGVDGLDLYRELFGQIAKDTDGPDYILAESLPPQHESLAAIAKVAGYTLSKTDDFIQLFTAD